MCALLWAHLSVLQCVPLIVRLHRVALRGGPGSQQFVLGTKGDSESKSMQLTSQAFQKYLSKPRLLLYLFVSVPNLVVLYLNPSSANTVPDNSL